LNGHAYGGGGGGVADFGAVGAKAGGNGANGIVVLRELL